MRTSTVVLMISTWRSPLAPFTSTHSSPHHPLHRNLFISFVNCHCSTIPPYLPPDEYLSSVISPPPPPSPLQRTYDKEPSDSLGTLGHTIRYLLIARPFRTMSTVTDETVHHIGPRMIALSKKSDWMSSAPQTAEKCQSKRRPESPGQATFRS